MESKSRDIFPWRFFIKGTSLGIESLFVAMLVGIAGCAGSSPPNDEIDKGVNWALSEFIEWQFRDRNLFESYKITNQYTEKGTDGEAHVYDFEASCLVRRALQAGNFGETAVYLQAKRDGDKWTTGDIEQFKGTFTLIKKGNSWYRQKTMR
jgi:hypothetical protein